MSYLEPGTIRRPTEPISMADHMRHVADIMREASNEPGADNAPILLHEQQQLIKLKNKGYPKHMYHATLDPVVVKNSKEEHAIISHGYVTTYIPHDYPKMLYRRNLKNFSLEPDDYVEHRTARDAAHETALRAERVKHGFTPWFYSLGELNAKHPLPDGPVDDPAVTIAALQAELTGYKSGINDSMSLDSDGKRGPGRPRKTQTDVGE
jgi:hypothetical protein